MTEFKLPTDQEKEATANTLKNIAELLKVGLFPGVNAVHVAQSIQWLETGASFFNVLKPETEEVKPDLQVVDNGQA